MKLLIAIMTCHRNYQKAHAQRQTWVKDIQENGFADVHFFLGRHKDPCIADDSSEVAPDTTWFRDVDDSYFGIPEKVRAICRWAYEHGYDYVMKCDDDVYIAPFRFSALPLDGRDYIGRFRGPHGIYPAHFASGFSYWLSRLAMQHVGYSKNSDWMDERFVANKLALEGIFGYHDPVNYLVTGPFTPASTILQRQILQNGTVFCEYNAAQIHELHKYLGHVQPVSNHPGLRQVQRVSITQEQFTAKPTDKPPQNKIERYLR